MIETEERRLSRRRQERGDGEAQNDQGRKEAHELSRRSPANAPAPTAPRAQVAQTRLEQAHDRQALRLAHVTPQLAISSPERPQPMQSADNGSITQILTQGLEISENTIRVI